MRTLSGIPVVDGVVIAEALVLEAEKYRLPGTQSFMADGQDPELSKKERARYREAVQAAKDEIAAQIVKRGPTHPASMILNFHQNMLEDEGGFHEHVDAYIESGRSAEHAVARRVNFYRRKFRESSYTARLVPDIDDLETTLLRHLIGEERETVGDLTVPVVVIARDLTPQQTLTLDLKMVLGFATDEGGKTSHTAILAQSLDLPAIVGLGRVTDIVTGGELVILDGRAGKVIIDPDEATLARYKERQKKFEAQKLGLEELKALPAETLDGHRLTLLANIAQPEEIEVAIKAGAEGIGLYRTEFLYSDENPDPSEEFHLKEYNRAIDLVGGRPLVIRTLDLGADKFVPAGISGENNPFLGCRSIRYCLMEREDVFLRQLRAILRASSSGDVRIMLPMISSLEELVRAKAMIEDAKRELRAEGIPYREDIPIGIMIEVPSAAIMADALAQHADFFSIGTNDLVQYVVAVDRTNQKVQELYEPAHPAVFRLLLTTIEAARRAKIPVSICGELSGDPMFTLPLIGLGLRDLSMAPSLIPRIKRFIRSITAIEAGRDMDQVLTHSSSTRNREYLGRRARDLDPEFFD
ncbi:MAG: phosphoenolpyruvate--protein phosphotransferase [Planctomycetes bacterium]|nr:phosphoenolpyruvate--protein phosphotransferase [Planctomycetota bacterium]